MHGVLAAGAAAMLRRGRAADRQKAAQAGARAVSSRQSADQQKGSAGG